MRQAMCTVFLMGLAGVAHATTILPADLGELSRDARVIVVGCVAMLEEHWTVDRRAINTLVILHVDTYLKGDFGPTVQFRTPGGRCCRPLDSTTPLRFSCRDVTRVMEDCARLLMQAARRRAGGPGSAKSFSSARMVFPAWRRLMGFGSPRPPPA